MLDVASEVCGYPKAKCGGGIKLWIWRCRRRELFRIWKQSQNEEDRKKYCEAKKDATRVVSMAMDQKAQEVAEEVDSYCEGCELFRIAK